MHARCHCFSHLSVFFCNVFVVFGVVVALRPSLSKGNGLLAEIAFCK